MRVIVITALLCVALTACGQQVPDPRGVGRDEVLLQVTATGQAETRPDEARFSAGVETIAPTAAAASAGNSEKMEQVVAALEGLDIKGDDLRTRQVTLSRIDYGPNRGRFQANNLIEVRVRNVERASAALGAAAEAGANILSGPDLRVSDPEAASRSAYAQAYKAARARAETYAGAAGLKVARVLAIRDGGESQGPIMYDVQMMAPPPPPLVRAESGPPVRLGLNSRGVAIRADFALAED